MKIENTNLNIPTISVGSAVSSLCELYTNAIMSNISFKALPTPFLWGPAGVGKSDGVKELSKLLSGNTGKNVVVTDIRLLLFSPVDLRGVPVADEHRQFTNWLKPGIFAMDDSPDTVNLLFLDELSAAPQSVQAAAYQICLDRKVGEHVLPDNCIVIAAGNRTTDQSVSYKMPKALCNRLMHFNITSDFEAWKEWAMNNDIDSRIIGYLSFDRTKLCIEPDTSDMAYPTPRSWSFVSNLLKASGKEPGDIHSLICACIGTGIAVEFEAWCKVFEGLPKIDGIMSGTCNRYPCSHDELYALTSGLTSAVREKGADISMAVLENCCRYVKRFPADFAMTFYKDIMGDKNIKLKLMKCPSMQEWLAKTNT